MSGAVVSCDSGLVGFRGLIGLTGDSKFVGFVIDFTHVSVTTVQGPQACDPYGSGQLEILNSCVEPMYPAAHASVLYSVAEIHVGGSCVQLSEAVVQSPQEDVEHVYNLL